MKRTEQSSYSGIIPRIIPSPCGTVYPYSVAEQIQSGEIFTEGQSVLIWHHCGFAYLYGACEDRFLEQVFRQFLSPDCTLTRRFILFTADPHTEQFFRAKQGLAFGTRYGFTYPEDRIPQPRPLPEGCQLCELSRELLSALQGRITPQFSWQSPEEFLRSGRGFCITCAGEPVSWAFSAAVSAEETDIGIETVPAYQHRGLGLLAAEQMIRDCIRQRKRPVWACDAGNTGSRKLAEKAGLIQTSEYTTIRTTK